MIAPIAGWLSDRLGSRLLCTAGATLIVIGQFFIATLGLDSSVPRIITPLLLTGLGWAIFNSPNQSAILGSVPQRQIRHGVCDEHDHGAHRQRNGRGAFRDAVYLRLAAAGLPSSTDRVAAELG